MESDQQYDSILHNLTEEELKKKIENLDIQLVEYASQRAEYDDTEKPSTINPNWMAQLPDSVKLTALSLPGTHNTVSLYGGPWSQCQSWSLMDIYKSGVRFADIRCRHFNDTLPIHHEIIYQKITFDKVLKETLKFLDYHPTETILMRIRQEYKPENNKKAFEDLVNEYLTKFLPEHRLWRNNYLPELKDARGKLIILRDYYDSRWVSYRELLIDDKWDVTTLLHVDSKWESVKKHLDEATKDFLVECYVTFTSGSGYLAFPSAVAKRINKRLWDLLKNIPGKNRWGIIVMDFPGAELIQAIINTNF